MAEADKPKTYAELQQENAELRAAVSSLQASLGSTRAEIVARDAEVVRLRKPKPIPRVLRPDAADKFQRPAFRR